MREDPAGGRRPTPVDAAVEGDPFMSRICHDCIGERVLKAEIRAAGDRGRCDWCEREARSLTGEQLADRVGPVFEAVVGPAEDGFREIGGRATWGPIGRAPAELMTELIEADDEGIGRELVGILSGRNVWDGHDDGYDVYDEDRETNELVDPASTRLRDDWVAFCERLRHGSRFFGSHAALDAILAPVLAGRFARRAIRAIVPGGPLSTLYRGRLTNDEPAQRKVYGRPLAQLAAPPPGIAGDGRMNAAGISVFYGASDVNTCLAELRVPVGGAAIVGRFEVIRPLRLLDLTRLDKLGETLSRFDEGYIERFSYQQFIRSFHDEIKRAVIPGRETLDYLPTQAVAEYLWTRPDPLDGIVFGSAQISGAHRNVVLFPHACAVEGVAAETRRKVRHIYDDGPTEDDPDRPATSRVILEPPPPAAPAAANPAAGLFEEDDWFMEGIAAASPADGVQPTLRLAPDGLQIVTVEAIRLKSTALPVVIEEWPDGPGF